MLQDKSLFDVEFPQREHTTIEKLSSNVNDVLKSAKSYLEDVKYKYLPPSFDAVHEYDSDEERRSSGGTRAL